MLRFKAVGGEEGLLTLTVYDRAHLPQQSAATVGALESNTIVEPGAMVHDS
jgi:hypothetical protein